MNAVSLPKFKIIVLHLKLLLNFQASAKRFVPAKRQKKLPCVKRFAFYNHYWRLNFNV